MTPAQRPKGGFPALSIRRMEGAECKGIGEPLRGPLEPEKTSSDPQEYPLDFRKKDDNMHTYKTFHE